MKMLDWLLNLRPSGDDLQRRVHDLVAQADDQTCEQWRLVNEARRARGEPPLTPNHPFRPRDLIDPCEGRSGA